MAHSTNVSSRSTSARRDEETWTIYWMDTSHPVLTEQVTGSFRESVGEFFAEELFNGRTVRLRFLRSSPSSSEARWEQACYDDEAQAWETHWIMEFSRVRQKS